MQYIKNFLNEFSDFIIIENTTDKIILDGILKKFLEFIKLLKQLKRKSR